MSTTDHLTSRPPHAPVGERRTLEERVAEQDARLQDLHRELQRTRQELETLRATVERLLAQSVATCKKCGATYDVFRHHYSIGLFDNIVYVKCPHCQTPMPVDPHLGVRPE
jgi:hypothetical protein